MKTCDERSLTFTTGICCRNLAVGAIKNEAVEPLTDRINQLRWGWLIYREWHMLI